MLLEGWVVHKHFTSLNLSDHSFSLDLKRKYSITERSWEGVLIGIDVCSVYVCVCVCVCVCINVWKCIHVFLRQVLHNSCSEYKFCCYSWHIIFWKINKNKITQEKKATEQPPVCTQKMHFHYEQIHTGNILCVEGVRFVPLAFCVNASWRLRAVWKTILK